MLQYLHAEHASCQTPGTANDPQLKLPATSSVRGSAKKFDLLFWPRFHLKARKLFSKYILVLLKHNFESLFQLDILRYQIFVPWYAWYGTAYSCTGVKGNRSNTSISGIKSNQKLSGLFGGYPNKLFICAQYGGGCTRLDKVATH